MPPMTATTPTKPAAAPEPAASPPSTALTYPLKNEQLLHEFVRQFGSGAQGCEMDCDAVKELCIAIRAALASDATPPGWPDPLVSPQAEAIRNGKIDDTEIRDLFDRMERELIQHRQRFVDATKAGDEDVRGALAKAVADERADIDDCLRACEKGSQQSKLPGWADIELLRDALMKLRTLRDQARARTIATTGDSHDS